MAWNVDLTKYLRECDEIAGIFKISAKLKLKIFNVILNIIATKVFFAGVASFNAGFANT